MTLEPILACGESSSRKCLLYRQRPSYILCCFLLFRLGLLICNIWQDATLLRNSSATFDHRLKKKRFVCILFFFCFWIEVEEETRSAPFVPEDEGERDFRKKRIDAPFLLFHDSRQPEQKQEKLSTTQNVATSQGYRFHLLSFRNQPKKKENSKTRFGIIKQINTRVRR